MKVFVAGASGVIGRRLIPLLVLAGHSVIAMTRSPDKAAAMRAAGAEPLVADALDENAVMAAVEQTRPEVIVHQLTAIPPRANFRTFERDFELTNRLRREGTDHLLAAAHSAGTRRLVAQSFAGWPYRRRRTHARLRMAAGPRRRHWSKTAKADPDLARPVRRRRAWGRHDDANPGSL